MQTCKKCNNQSPDTARLCSNCNADLSEWSETVVALKRIQENSRVIYVRISVSQDCCPICRQAEGAFAKESAPKLPIEGCSNGLGCRCYYQPVLEHVFP